MCSPPPLIPTNTELTCESYSKDMVSALHALYEDQICCDITLSADCFETRAHKVVLMAGSSFLKSLLLEADLPVDDAISFPGLYSIYMQRYM